MTTISKKVGNELCIRSLSHRKIINAQFINEMQNDAGEILVLKNGSKI